MLCLCVFYTMCVLGVLAGKMKKPLDPLELEIRMVVESPCGCSEQSLHPLKEKQGLEEIVSGGRL